MRILSRFVVVAGLFSIQAEAVAGRTRVPHYTLRVQVDPAVRRLEAEVWIRNPPGMRFYLHPGFAVRQVEIRSKAVVFHEDPGAPKLPFSPAARAVVVNAPRAGALRIVYGGVMKERLAGVNEIAPELVELACYSAWYPVFEGLKEYRFDLEARLPESFTAVTNGRQRMEGRQDGWVIKRWESYRPGFDIVLLASPLLRRYEDGASGVAVYAHEFPATAISSKRAALADGIAELTRRFGPPQVNAGTCLVYSPRSGWGYARAPLIVVSEQRALGLLGSESGAEQDFHDNAHELAHFWWMVADPGTPHDWINEGLAEYSAYCVSAIYHGPASASRRLAEYQHRATQSQTTGSIAETPGDSPDREVNRYNKAPLMFIEAERRFGRARLDRLLRTLHDRFAWTGRATTELFLELASARMGPHAAAFFKQELYRRSEPPRTRASRVPNCGRAMSATCAAATIDSGMWGWTKALLLAALAIAIGVCCTAQCAAPQARDGRSSESRTASKREGYSSLRERDQSLRKAVALHKQGSFQAAESLLRQVLRDRPADSAALSLLGVVLDAQRKHEEAEHSYLQALASAPRSAGAWNNLGNHYLALEQAEKAESAFLKLLEINPRHANANVQLARIAVLRKRGAEALRYLGNLGLSDQKEPAIGLLRAEALHLVGRRQKATTTVDRLLQEFGRDPKVAFTLGVTLASWKEYGRAEAAFSRALEYDPSNPEVLYNLGVVALRSDRLERAQGVFESLLKRRPGDAGAHFHLAQVLVRRGETERALLSLLEARKLAPDRTDILLMLAQTSAEAGFSTDAAIAYEEYLRRNPSDALARRERGYAYARAGMVPEALADLTWYVAKFPQDPAGHLELAMTYTLVDRAKAFYHIEEALRLRQEFVPARQLRGALQYLEGRASEALPDLEFVADRNPKNVRVLEQLGQAYLALNRPAEAEKLLRRAVELAPENRRALMHLGRALSDLGRSEEAATYLDRLERIGPDRGSVKSGGGLFDFLALSPTEQRERYERNLMAAMRTRPSDPELKVRWASLLMADGKTEASLAGFREVLELSPNAAVLAAGSRSLIDGGHYELARIYLERLVRMDPRPEHVLDLAIAVSQTTGAAAGLRELDGIAEGSRTGDYWLLRAQLLEQQERTAEAVESVRHGVRAAATRPELYIQASLFLLKHGRDGEALAVMEEAANTLPEQRDILLTKVMLLEVLGKNVEAQNLLRRIQLQWPEWSRVHLVRSVLLELESKADEAALALRAAAALGEEKPEALAVRVRTSRKREPPAKEDRAAVVRSLLLALYPPGHWR